ncbi:hypothetical protein [Paracidovorax konjaci]|uniref:hypothetical protein n=1 Tax=Paracidovorax konjaci TaxID=32040 RepID=UPI00158772DC|nr:hypothetical protein [Paracidovorax konjaci]
MPLEVQKMLHPADPGYHRFGPTKALDKRVMHTSGDAAAQQSTGAGMPNDMKQPAQSH